MPRGLRGNRISQGGIVNLNWNTGFECDDFLKFIDPEKTKKSSMKMHDIVCCNPVSIESFGFDQESESELVKLLIKTPAETFDRMTKAGYKLNLLTGEYYK